MGTQSSPSDIIAQALELSALLSTSGRSNRSASATARSACSIAAALSPITLSTPASSASTRASSRLGPSGCEQADGLVDGGAGLLAARQPPQRPRQHAQRVALAQRVAQLPPERQGLTPHELGLGRLVDDPELGGERVEDLGPGAGVDGAVLARPQGQAEVGEGLAVRGELGGTTTRRPRVPQRRHVVARSVRVEREPGVVIAPGCRERGEDPRVEVGAPRLGHGIRHGEAGDLVPEPQLAAVGDEQPRIEDLVVGGVRGVDDGRQEEGVDALAGQGGRVEEGARGQVEGRDARHHGIPGGCRQPRAAGADHLGDEVGIATGQGVHLGGVEAGAGDELRDRGARQRWQGHPAGGALAGELAEGQPQRRRRRRTRRRGR